LSKKGVQMPVRVYDLAKEFKVSSSVLMRTLKELNYPVRSHMKFLDDDVVKLLRTKFVSHKIRISVLANDIGVSADDIVSFLNDNNIVLVDSPKKYINKDIVEKVRERFCGISDHISEGNDKGKENNIPSKQVSSNFFYKILNIFLSLFRKR